MKKFTRDLLLLKHKYRSGQDSIQREVNQLNALLHEVETSSQFHIVYELIDVNRFKVLHDQLSVSKALKPRGLKPFQFLINRN